MDARGFLEKVEACRQAGWRLVLINATSVLPSAEAAEGAVDLSWTFEREGKLEHLLQRVTGGEEVPSISSLFHPAFLYENEIRDLFGVNVTGLTVDFKGELYRTATKVPMSPRAIRARLEARDRR